MAAPLDSSDPELTSAIKEVLAGTLEWVTFSYVAKSYTKIKVDQKGSDGYDEVLEAINEGKVQYFFIRFQIVNMPKFVYIAYCGENVAGVLRGAFNSHVHEVANFFKKIQAPVHVSITARNEADFDEAKIKSQLTKAMGANYDAGAKHQGLGGGVSSTKEGVTLHKTAQDESSKTNTARALPGLPQLLDTRDQFWKETNKSGTQPKEQPKGAVIDEKERQKFWSQTPAAAPVNASGQQKTLVDDAERQAFWDQQKKAEEERQEAMKKAGGPVDAPAGASSIRSKFEQQAKPAEPAKPAPTAGKKWTPPPAAAKPAAPAPLTSGPPKSTPVAAPPPTPAPTPAPVPAAAPPALPAKDGPPPFSAKPPASSPPVPSGGPPTKSAPRPPAGGPPVSSPPPFVPTPEPEPEPEPEPAPEPEPVQDYGTAEPASDGIENVQAIYPFQAEQPTDLSFNEGDIILVLDTSDPSGWWKGRDTFGNEGYFPSNFVQPLSG